MSSHQDSLQTFRWHYDEFNDTNFQIRGRTLFFIIVIFSIILLVTLLFIYTRWICRFVAPRPSSSSSAASAPPPPRGLDMVTINNMPIVLYKSAAAAAGNHFSEGGECCICLGIFGDKEAVKVLPPCRHCFHSECVDMWLVTQSSCPLCRASLRVDSPV